MNSLIDDLYSKKRPAKPSIQGQEATLQQQREVSHQSHRKLSISAHSQKRPIIVTGPPTREHWKDDNTAADCCACLAKFTLVCRRHHCRKCGDIFCSSCSSVTKPIHILKALELRPTRSDE